MYCNDKVIRSITIVTTNLSVPEGEKPTDKNQFDRRVSGVKLKFSDDTETSIGEISHHTAKDETYQLEECELITEVGVCKKSVRIDHKDLKIV